MLTIWLRNEQTARPLTFSVRRTIKRSARGAFRTLEKGGQRAVSILVCDIIIMDSSVEKTLLL